MSNDYDEIKQKVEQILKDIAEESLSLENVDLGLILNQWKDICQSLDNKVYSTPHNRDDTLLRDNEDNSFTTEIQDENKREEMYSSDAQTKNLYDLNLVEDDGKESWISDVKDDSENSSYIESEDQINHGEQKPDWLDTLNVDEALSEILEEDNVNDGDMPNDYLDIHKTGLLLEPPVYVTWDKFEKDICYGDILLAEKCKNFCSKLDENIDVIEANLWILSRIKSLQSKVKEIINDNSLVFSGTEIMDYIEQRIEFCHGIARHYKEIKHILVVIRKTFPKTENTLWTTENDIIEGNESSEDEYIENRPIPNFWP